MLSELNKHWKRVVQSFWWYVQKVASKSKGIDARGIPTAACPSCGGTIINLNVVFDQEDYTVGMYFLDACCSQCGTLLTAPTPQDLRA